MKFYQFTQCRILSKPLKGWFVGGFLVPSVRRGQEWRTQLLRVHAGLFLTTFESVSSNRSLLTANLEFHKCALLDQANNVTNLDKCKYDLQANNVTNLDTPEDKLNWIFTAFDTDGGGTIDVEEIRYSFNIFPWFYSWISFQFFFRASEYLVYCWFHNFFLVFQVSLLEKEDLWNWI